MAKSRPYQPRPAISSASKKDWAKNEEEDPVKFAKAKEESNKKYREKKAAEKCPNSGKSEQQCGTIEPMATALDGRRTLGPSQQSALWGLDRNKTKKLENAIIILNR